MDTSRRAAITALGTAGLTTAIGALAIGEYADDDRDRTGPGVAVVDDDGDPDADTVADGLGAVRVVHLSPSTPTVDVTADGEQLVAGVAVDDRSPYLQFEPGTYTIRFTATDDPETILFEDEVTVETAYYTIAVTGDLESDGVEPTVLVDAGAALVRVVHTSSDAPPVDVTARRGRPPLFEDVAFGTPTAYAPIPTGSYTLEAVATEASSDEPTTDETDESDGADDSESSGSGDGADAAENDTAPAGTDETPANDSSGDGAGDAGTEDAGDGTDENESAAETDDDTSAEAGRENASDAPADVDAEDVPDDVGAEDVPDDIDAEDIPDDVDAEDIPDDIDAEDIPDDIDAEDVPDDFSEDALPGNSSRRVDGEPDVSLLSADRNQADPAASIDVTLERGRAYTGYVTDALESADRRGSDRDLSLTVTVDGEPGAAELADESGESY